MSIPLAYWENIAVSEKSIATIGVLLYKFGCLQSPHLHDKSYKTLSVHLFKFGIKDLFNSPGSSTITLKRGTKRRFSNAIGALARPAHSGSGRAGILASVAG